MIDKVELLRKLKERPAQKTKYFRFEDKRYIR